MVHRKLSGVLLALGLQALASLQCATGLADGDLTRSAPCQLKLATGKRGKGFSKLYRDIASVCGARLVLCEVETAGGLENLMALSSNSADLGLVQVDTLDEMRSSDQSIAGLQSVLALSTNLLHVVALKAGFVMHGERSLSTLFMEDSRTIHLEGFSSLKGLPVALVGSAQLLGRSLDRTLELGMRLVDAYSDEQALAALRAGEVAAVFSVSSWPHGVLDKLAGARDLTLLPYDLPVQAPRVLVRKNYANLGIYNIPFLGLPSVLVARPFAPTGARGQAVAALKQCILDNLQELREGAFDPAWAEVKPVQ